MDILMVFTAGLFGLIIGIIVYYFYAKKQLTDLKLEKTKIEEEAKRLVEIAKKEAELQFKDKMLQVKSELERELKEKKDELIAFEKRLAQKEESIEKRNVLIESREVELLKKEKNINALEKELLEKKTSLDNLILEHKKTLEKVANLSAEEAKKELVSLIEDEAKHEAAKKIREIEEELKETSVKKAQEYVALAIQRIAGDFVTEMTVSSVPLPSDEMKGRIIGREGRNIRAFESITGVDVIIDDTPEVVVISCHNPVRREIARLSLEKLIQDGRIHPARIEEVVEKSKLEVEQAIKEAGEKALFDVGLHNVHPEIVKLLGTLKYRTSYGQNVLQHSVEVAYLCGIMAAELNVSIKQAKRAGLLHDIGKAVDHEIEGSHALIGAEILKKHGEHPKIINAILSHHGEEAPNSVIAVLVQAADSISAARPGARRETLESYVKRIEELEKIAVQFPGVTKAYAIQAGREVRIMVENTKVSDDDAYVLARDIAKKIESELTYPGQIKVTVIRETRAIEYAR
ncbi:MAG: ribonuclease Y [Thermodesulfovibrio sp.]|nr:ribonuclease Y [Thermodesulfovibrio sp.]